MHVCKYACMHVLVYCVFTHLCYWHVEKTFSLVIQDWKILTFLQVLNHSSHIIADLSCLSKVSMARKSSNNHLKDVKLSYVCVYMYIYVKYRVYVCNKYTYLKQCNCHVKHGCLFYTTIKYIMHNYSMYTTYVSDMQMQLTLYIQW